MMISIDQNILEHFRKLVSDNVGLNIRKEDNETFRKALSLQMKKSKISDPLKYLNLLESVNEESMKEWKSLIIPITTGESYFFRDKGHFFLLQNTILPELIEKNKTKRSLRIWSAGCSTGEEPYSIAILLTMILPDIKNWEISITGTDINEESLQKAMKGIYSQWSFRTLDKDKQKTNFTRHPNGWEINENIKSMVTFKFGNLMEEEFFYQNHELADMDLIICRNVFIYFEKKAVDSVLSKFKKILNHGGYLITGHAELYGHDLSSLRQMMFPEAMIYKKTEENEANSGEISHLSEYIKEIKEVIIKKIPVAKHAIKVLKTVIIKSLSPVSELENLIDKGQYTEAIAFAENFLITQKENYELLILMAKAYANSGDYDNASVFCRKAMLINADSADPFFLMAQVEIAKGNNEEAKNLFKKAIYLDHSFIAAYCELGALYANENDIPRANKSRAAAIGFLKTLPSQSSVKPYNITAGELLEYVEYIMGSENSSSVPAAAGGKKFR